MAPLQCFRSELYAPFKECEELPQYCIAPTAKLTRCLMRIPPHSQETAAQLKVQAESLCEGDAREAKIRQYILLHCCRKWHRQKLEDDRTGCLVRLVKAYGTQMSTAKHLPKSKEVSPIIKTETSNSDPVEIDLVATCSQTKSYMRVTPKRESSIQTTRVLRSQSNVTASGSELSEYASQEAAASFVRYQSGPRDSIRNVLLTNVPQGYADHGVVYSFVWPAHPEFVKIGFTKNSAESRIASWRSCHPGARLADDVMYDYPRRIERLIHLEMAEHRYRIDNCSQCGSSHVEWFQISTGDVLRVMQGWKELETREALYGPDRQLTAKWRDRILTMDGPVTAKALLGLLDAEAAAKRTERKRTEPDLKHILKMCEELHAKLQTLSPKSSLKTNPTTGTTKSLDDLVAQIKSESLPELPIRKTKSSRSISRPAVLADKTNTTYTPVPRLVKSAA